MCFLLMKPGLLGSKMDDSVIILNHINFFNIQDCIY